MPRSVLVAGMVFLLPFSIQGNPADGQPTSALSIQWKLPNRKIFIEPGQKLKVSLTVRDKHGKGVEGLDIQLGASVGRFIGLTDLGGGGYLASYRMPSQRHPHAVILAALLPGGPPAWTVLPLWSKTTLGVNTDKPRVQVTLRLGKRTFGPSRTDHTGKAKIPVNVAPGETEAKAVAVDEFGNRTQRRVAIPVPPSSRFLSMTQRTELVADGMDGSDMYVIAIQNDGTPSKRLVISTKHEQGRLSRPKRLGPGLFHIRYTAPPKLTQSEAGLIIVLKRRPNLERQKFVFHLTAGPPEQLVVAVEPNVLFADGKSTAELNMTVLDRAGNLLGRTTPQVSCSMGTVAPITRSGPGVFQAKLSAPTGTSGSMNCVALVKRPAQAPLRKEISLEVVPPIPASMQVSADPDRLSIEKPSSANIKIRIMDRHDNPIEGAFIKARTTLGTLSRVTQVGHGIYTLVYTPPADIQKNQQAHITIESGSEVKRLHQSVIIQLQAPPHPPARLSLGPLVGMTTNFARIHLTAFSLEGIVRLPFGAQHLYLAIEGGCRFGHETTRIDSQVLWLRTDLEYLSAHLSLMFKVFPRQRFTPYGGIGAGAEFVRWSLSRPGGINETGHVILPGALAFVGGELRAGRGAFFVTLRYLYAYLASSTPAQSPGNKGSNIKGNLGGMEIACGYRLFF